MRDTKDWTWVLARPCPECGYDASVVAVDDLPGRTRAAARDMSTALRRPGSGERPDPDTWSTLEYACHVRDVCIVTGARLATMLANHDPEFLDWDQDATARDDCYGEQDPAAVARELAAESERIAELFQALRPEQHDRPGRRSNGSAFTVTTLGRYFLHDLVHHVHDVRG